MAELKTLKETGTLTPEKTAIVTKSIETHLEDINKSAVVVVKTEPEVVKEVVNAITKNINDDTTITDTSTKTQVTSDTTKESIKKDPSKTVEVKEVASTPANTEIIDKLQEEKTHLESLTSAAAPKAPTQ